MEQTSDLTKTFILQPLRQALEAHDITEDTVIGVFADILNDDSQPGATRLNACKMFLQMLGLVHDSRHVDLEITHKVADALQSLEDKRKQRVAQTIGGSGENGREIEYIPATNGND